MSTPAPQTLDVSGLPPAAVAAVAAVVEQLRAANPDHRPHETREQWVARLYAWADSHERLDYEVETDRGVLNERDGAQ
jgi:hypothetical protein